MDLSQHILGSGALDNFIGVTVVAVLLSWFGPYVLASRIIQLEKREKRVEEKRKAVNPEEASAPPSELLSCQFAGNILYLMPAHVVVYIAACFDKVRLWFLTHGLQRSSVSFVAFRFEDIYNL